MNPAIEKLWNEASEKFNEDRATSSVRALLVEGSNVWGTPITEVVNIVYDDIESMPWHRDPRDVKESEVDSYFDTLKEKVKKKIDWRRCSKSW